MTRSAARARAHSGVKSRGPKNRRSLSRRTNTEHQSLSSPDPGDPEHRDRVMRPVRHLEAETVRDLGVTRPAPRSTAAANTYSVNITTFPIAKRSCASSAAEQHGKRDGETEPTHALPDRRTSNEDCKETPYIKPPGPRQCNVSTHATPSQLTTARGPGTTVTRRDGLPGRMVGAASSHERRLGSQSSGRSERGEPTCAPVSSWR